MIADWIGFNTENGKKLGSNQARCAWLLLSLDSFDVQSFPASVGGWRLAGWLGVKFAQRSMSKQVHPGSRENVRRARLSHWGGNSIDFLLARVFCLRIDPTSCQSFTLKRSSVKTAQIAILWDLNIGPRIGPSFGPSINLRYLKSIELPPGFLRTFLQFLPPSPRLRPRIGRLERASEAVPWETEEEEEDAHFCNLGITFSQKPLWTSHGLA